MAVIPSSNAFTSSHHILSFRSGISSRGRRLDMLKVANSMNPAPAFLAALILFSSSAAVTDDETLSNVPQMLSGDDQKQARIKKPRSRKAERCTSKCVGTCILGGAGAPGEGPLNVRRPLVVFKKEFRSRQYCLVECSDICNLIKDGEDGP